MPGAHRAVIILRGAIAWRVFYIYDPVGFGGEIPFAKPLTKARQLVFITTFFGHEDNVDASQRCDGLESEEFWAAGTNADDQDLAQVKSLTDTAKTPVILG